MPQVLKEEIHDRIFQAGIDVFYEKDYRSAKMQDIAEKAHIPVGLIYTYFRNKEELFDKIASSIYVDFDEITEEEERAAGLPSERYKNVAEKYLLDLLEKHEIFVILMDKSKGTKYEDSKDKMICSIERHIKKRFAPKISQARNDMLFHILASNFAESILEVARHYKNREFAHTMLGLVTKCYYEGVNAL
ncbi:TetR/AcrR family transcriptional regulator [Synergistes jonesii]|uniref:TetR family transcriptional regulator n=1 Tax=Synergistes jonesii TaxID=2754 RepID=A0A073ISZ5_9BACT|nr:TetR/AcrR family transcriptional regulator [Synergistes jonesii]KEJ92571.1 TetR family transcriptional regulator [Synergistes jonesii]OFB61737.1 TetR family transcriptional regulator [Synergistes jonesii]OFB63230.1 TetR family transcriptional regulator [Synergistes jonesii]OFB64102.1 TetR family transcriptional regulator [Synergistes jonesii]OFB67936.1 TetR family transcriptional regulator [Synergistes jonesii]